jgi:hypothetical protein
MSNPSSANHLLNDIQQAEKDLALYAAIIGCRPTVSKDAPPLEPIDAPDSIETLLDESDSHRSHRLSIWMHHVSHEAKRRIHEARMRLAS